MKLLSRFSWLAVVMAALILSGWNLLFVGHAYGLPYPIAAIVSVVFDGASFVAATLALAYSTQGDSGFTPRLLVTTMATASAFLGSQHAAIAHDPWPARIAFGMPAIVAITLAELQMRYTRRAALRRQERLPAQLPRFGKEAWLLFPLRTIRTLRQVVAHRLASIESRYAGSIEYAPALTLLQGEKRKLTQTPPNQIRSWARIQGMSIGPKGPIPVSIRTAYELANTVPQSMNGKGS